MAAPEWNLISQLGSQVLSCLPEAAGLAIAQVDQSGTVFAVNPAGKRAWGLESGSSLPESVTSRLHAGQPDASGLILTSLSGRAVLGAESTKMEGWILIGSDPQPKGNGSPPSNFTSLIEKLPVSVTMFHADGTVVYANAEVERMTGFKMDEIVGRSFWLEAVHPEDRWKLMGAVRCVIEGEQAVVNVRLLTKNQRVRLAEMHLHAMAHEGKELIESAVLDVTERSQVEDALYHSEALYRTFLEQSPIGMLHLDAAGTVTFENHPFRLIIGESVEDAWLGRSIFSIPGLDAGIFPALRALLDEGKPFDGEEAAYERGEWLRTLELHGSPIHHPEGGIVGGVLMVEDRTYERRRERELQLRNRYSTAESSLREVALADPREDGFLRAAAQILGQASRSDRVHLLMNNAAGDCSTNRACWWKTDEDEPMPLVVLQHDQPALRRMSESGKGLHATVHSGHEATALLEMTAAAEAVWAPFFDEDRLGGFVLFERTRLQTTGDSSAWGASELGLMEELVRVFETLWTWILAGNRYRHITSTIRDCLFNLTYDEDGDRSYLLLTPQIRMLTGYASDEILARYEESVHWSDVIVHEEDRALVDAHDDVLRSGRESRISYRVQHRDGSVRWLQEYASSQEDALGDIIVSGILTDVSEQKTAETVLTKSRAQAETASRLKSAFIATMSHEIRTPMGAVNGYADVLARELSEHELRSGTRLPEQVTEFVQAIRENSQKLLVLVNDMFELSNLDPPSFDGLERTSSLREIVSRSTDKIADALSHKGIDLRVELDAGDLKVTGDPQRIEQIVDHLLSNASKFTETGSVTVKTGVRRDGRAEIEIRDTGVGFSEEYVEQLFTPFVQEDSRLNRRYEGSGLGLPLARRLVNQLNGELEAESVKDEGSTFRIILPTP